MGKGRRRNTAKTGDKALYVQKSHQQQQHSRPKRASNVGGGNDNDDNHDDDDNVYDPVDRFHRRREQKQQEEEFLRLDGNDESHGSDDEGNNVEAVMDLGVGGSDDDDDGSSRSSQGAGSSSTSASGSQTSESDEEEDEGDEDDSLEERGEEVEDVRDWGRRKSAYYHGDTADLEIGQEQDDAFLEEEAAKEIQKARMRELSEEDFVLEEDNDDDIRDAERTGKSSSSLFARVPPAASTAVAPKGLSHKLSRREKGRLLDRQSPEFLPLVRHFADVTRELHGRTDVAARALLEGEAGAAETVGATPLGCEFLLTKAMIETASALNLAAYLLLKSEQPPQQQHKKDLASANASLSSHPVLSHLRRLHKLSTQLEAVLDKVPGLSDQLDKLVQAAALMKGDATINDESRTDGSDDEAPEAKGRSDDIDANSFDDHEEDVGSVSSGKEAAKVAPLRIGAVSSASSSSNSDSEDEEVRRKRVLDEARFALRPKEVEDGAVAIPWKRRPAPDFGEDVPEAQESIGKKKAFAAALNSIQQRAAKSTIKRSRMAEDLDDFLDREDDFMAGDDDHEHFGGHGTGKARDRGNDEEYDEAIDPELDEDGEGDFYSLVARKNQSRKEARKALYKVAPKYPRIEQEVDGERAVSRQILKNRGLVPHKNRLNRNPRVKKREQYRKALIRRKGAVREVRTDEGHIYGGEQTGIKTGLSRSRKLV